MKKLLHLQLLPLLSGAQNFSLHLLEGLDPDEFEIWVACQPGGALVDEVLARGYHFLPVRNLRHPVSWRDLPAFAELWFKFRKHRFDIVHTNSSKTGLLGRVTATLAKTPLILHTAHGTAFQDEQSFARQTIYKLLERLANRFCRFVVFVNNSDREKCLRLGLVDPNQAVTVYNALPPRLTAKLEQIAEQRTFDPARRDFVVGSALRFSQQKNVVNLIGAACRACKAEPRLKFILPGDGELLSLCRQIVRSHGLNERILLPGWDSEIEKWLPLYDAFILYSRWEAQPLSVIEAMYSGLPVLASRIPALQELVTPETGWLIGLDDHNALAECLASMAQNTLAAFQMGRQALQRIRIVSNYQMMLSGYLQIYRGEADPSGEEL